jgi:hypothetical protein
MIGFLRRQKREREDDDILRDDARSAKRYLPESLATMMAETLRMSPEVPWVGVPTHGASSQTSLPLPSMNAMEAETPVRMDIDEPSSASLLSSSSDSSCTALVPYVPPQSHQDRVTNAILHSYQPRDDVEHRVLSRLSKRRLHSVAFQDDDDDDIAESKDARDEEDLQDAMVSTSKWRIIAPSDYDPSGRAFRHRDLDRGAHVRDWTRSAGEAHMEID